MTDQSLLEQNVMRQVHRIRVLRLIISGAVFAVTAALLALYALGREVWVARIFENSPQGMGGHILYFIYAFEHTRFVVQVLVVLCIGSLVYLMRDLTRWLSLSRQGVNSSRASL